MQRVRNILRLWLPLAAVGVMLCGVIYIVAQQGLRISANDPQIQMAQDAAAVLARGDTAASLMPAKPNPVEISQSLAPFLMIFGDSGEPLASSARLHGQMPALPAGLLDYVRQHGEDRVTWQPEGGVRMAAVIVAVPGGPGGFVLAGRSLLEVEKRESLAQLLSGLGALVTLVGSLGVVAFCEFALSAGGTTAR
jgi:hypothetical protein